MKWLKKRFFLWLERNGLRCNSCGDWFRNETRPRINLDFAENFGNLLISGPALMTVSTVCECVSCSNRMRTVSSITFEPTDEDLRKLWEKLKLLNLVNSTN